MNSLRRWLYRPKRSDSSLLAQFYFADEDLNLVAAELDSFEGRKDPERCTTLVNQLRACQARVLNVVFQMMDEQVKDFRASRDFRVKFPDDVIQENLAGQLWFGAECLAAGSSIMNREVESACMRPLARALTKNLDSLRNILREQCLRSIHDYTETIKESLIIFDKLFAEFELSYVSAMVPVKTAHEYDMVQEITVLFSETVQRALKIGLLTRDIIDEYDPALMFTIPRLAIVSGVHIFRDGPLNPDNDPWNLSEMFRPFQTLLLKIRELLDILTDEELSTLERALCSQEEPSFLISLEEKKRQNAREERRRSREERKHNSATGKKKKDKEESDDGSMENELTALEIAERLEALALNFEMSQNLKLAYSKEHPDNKGRSHSTESSCSSSSSSYQSEVEAEETHATEVETVDRSEQAGDAQVQNFTKHLYCEAKLDSHSLTLSNTVVDHRHSAFSPEFVDPPGNNSTNETPEDTTSRTKSSSASASHNHTTIDASLEAAAVGRAHFAMNKCDSNDSGLQSEVLSNSDSTFTISSSDSNQHMPITDITAVSEGHQNCQNPTDELAAKNHSSAVVVEHAPLIGNMGNACTESRTSSDTLVSETEEKNCCVQVCLNSPSDCKEDGPEAASISEVSTEGSEQREVLPTASDAAEQTGSASRQAKDTSLSATADPSLHLETVSLQGLAQSPEPLSGALILAPLIKDLKDSNHHLCKNRDCSHDCKVSSLASATCVIEGEIAAGSLCESSKRGLESHEQSHILPDTVTENSGLEYSRKNSSVKGNFSNNTLHDRGGVCAGVVHAAGEAPPEDGMGNCALFDASAFTSESFHIRPPSVPPSAVSEDRENNNDVKDCAIPNQNIDVDFLDKKSSVQSEVTQLEAKDNLTESSSEITPVISHSPSISATNTEASTSQPIGIPDSSNLLLSLTKDDTQHSGKLTSTSPAHHQQNEIHNHTPTTNTSHTPASGPQTVSITNGYRSNKGSSKARSFKKSSKIKKQPQETSSSLGQRSGLPGQAKALMESQLLDSECNHSSETSSYNSDCGDQEEIDLAIKAAENATRQQVRARFQSNSDMIHRLFVCISGVADQLQTNFAGDLRNILRAVFDMNCSEPVDISTEDKCKDTTPLEAAYRAMSHASRTARRARNSSNQKPEPPLWIPDEQSNECMSCQVPFTFVRRRHHCRNCGKIFCSRCSSNCVPLPHFGQDKAVRVCNRCYMFQAPNRP